MWLLSPLMMTFLILWTSMVLITKALDSLKAITFTVTRLLRLLERKMDGSKNYTIYGSQSDSHSSITIHEGEEA